MGACAGAHTLALLEAIRPQLDRYEWAYAPLVVPGFGPTYAEHAAITHAVRDGTVDAIEGAVRANWFNGNREAAVAAWREGFAANKFNPWGKRCAEMLTLVESGGGPSRDA